MRVLLPALIGLLAALTFPEFAYNLISYYYGEVSSLGTSQTIGTVSNSQIIFVFLVVCLSLWGVARFLVWRKRESPRLGFFASLIFALALPILGYAYVFFDIRKEDNITTGMYLTVFRGDLEHLQRLIQIGGDPNRILSQGNEHQHTLLMIASSAGNEEIVRTLLNAGADLSLKNKKGKTAIGFAKEKGHEAIVNLLEQ
jgi:hypothetical protein